MIQSGFKLVFGWWGDAQTWPETPASNKTSLGETVIGPAGLLDILETILGLGGPATPHAKRIAAWQAKMRACDNDIRLWSRSFKIDPWATARLTLGWRDELKEAGWNPTISGSQRLRDISAIEMIDLPMPNGTSDRLRSVIAALSPGCQLPIASLHLIDSESCLPAGWRQLLAALKSVGVPTTEIPQIVESADGDLRRLRASEREPLVGDGSVNVLFADTELTAAECLAGWLASEPSGDRTVIVTGQATELLDVYLADRGLPRVGQSDRSPFRGALQMLSLAFATSWEPFDARPLLDLLLLPRPPVPRRVAREFSKLLQERPGLGHEQWKTAWAFASEWLAKQPSDNIAPNETRLAEWREWIEPARFRPEPGMPIEIVKSICGRVQQWAFGRDRGLGDPVLTMVGQVAGDLADAVSATGLVTFPRPLIERMIDQVVADGLECPLAVAEASDWTVVRHPGGIFGPVDRLIWWGFVDPAELPKSGPWTDAERKLLTDSGCPLDDGPVALERHGAAWRRAILAPQSQIILVRPGGAKVPVHPVWHEMQPRLQDAAVGVSCSAEDILRNENSVIAARTQSRIPITYQSPPSTRRQWVNSKPISLPTSTSVTAIEDLLTCPLRWTLANVAKIRRGALQRMAGEDQLLGNLAHEIARSIFQKGAPPATDTAQAMAAQLLRELIPQIAAPLALPGYAALLAEAEVQVPHAIGELARQLAQSGMTVNGCEVDIAGQFPDGTTINGRIDLLAIDRQGNPVVFDLKWARAEKRYREKMALGQAIQLAAYGHIVSTDTRSAPAGYFLIRQAALLGSVDGPFQASSKVAGPDMAATWQSSAAAWALRRSLVGAGRVIAPGVALAEGAVDIDPLPAFSPEPPCHYCDYAGACGGTRSEVDQ